MFYKCSDFQIGVSDDSGRLPPTVVVSVSLSRPPPPLIIRFKQHRPTRDHISGMAARVGFCIVWRAKPLSLIASNYFHLLVPLSPVDQFGFCLIYTKKCGIWEKNV